ncbi:MAG: hypothetical protein M3P06_23515 [Acidobacteriota bacterium]|nr:hypothetical protein [Acidobacteriota bacterium]
MKATLHVQISGLGRTTANSESLTTAADAALWRDAAALLRERAYVTATGAVRVRAGWNSFLDRDDDDRSIALDVEVVDERERPEPRDAGSFVELYFHDAFLLLNLAVPGSFGGDIATLADGHHRASEVALSARLFEYAWATASLNGWPAIEPLPLADVVRWYDALQIGTQQVATANVAKALFLLLHLSRAEENESASMLRLGQALEALFEGPALQAPIAALLGDWDKLAEVMPRFLDLRDAIVHGTAPVLHPMADDALDDRVDDASIDLVNAADFASSIVVGALQAFMRYR